MKSLSRTPGPGGCGAHDAKAGQIKPINEQVNNTDQTVAPAAVFETTTAASFHAASALHQTTRPACCFILRTELAKAAMNTAVRIRITVGAGALSR